MTKVESLTGGYLTELANTHYPYQVGKRIAQYEAMAARIGISKRALVCYMSEERRVPQQVEDQVIALWGEPPKGAWRTVTIRGNARRDDKKTIQPRKPLAEPFWKVETYDGEWRKLAQLSVAEIATKLQRHKMGDWIRHQDNDMDYDWVSECTSCEALAALDESAREISGMALRVGCGKLMVAEQARS
jgi:hypothetical protein